MESNTIEQLQNINQPNQPNQLIPIHRQYDQIPESREVNSYQLFYYIKTMQTVCRGVFTQIKAKKLRKAQCDGDYKLVYELLDNLFDRFSFINEASWSHRTQKCIDPTLNDYRMMQYDAKINTARNNITDNLKILNIIIAGEFNYLIESEFNDLYIIVWNSLKAYMPKKVMQHIVFGYLYQK